jgi:hypothetical protein
MGVQACVEKELFAMHACIHAIIESLSPRAASRHWASTARSAIVLFGLAAVPAAAQWLPSSATSGPVYYNGGNVGVGTATPSGKLHVVAGSSGATANSAASIFVAENDWDGGISILTPSNKDGSLFFGNPTQNNLGWLSYVGASNALSFGAAGYERIRITQNGNVGIGTASPQAPFETSGNIRITGLTLVPTSGAGLEAWYNSSANIGAVTAYDRTASVYTQLRFNGSVVAINAASGGNVGIGTTSPQYKLAVNGTIGAKEVIVIGTGWADYVFRPNYRLRPLSEVRDYIRQNHHLPDIPSESEVRTSGVGVGEMQAKLLAKVEELTLHLIQMEDRNSRLEARSNRIEARNNRLEGENRKLHQRVARIEAAAVGRAESVSSSATHSTTPGRLLNYHQ